MKALLYTVYLAGQGLESQFPPIGGTATDQQVEDAYAACVSADSFTDLAGATHQTQKASLYYNARFNEIGAFQGGDLHEPSHNRVTIDPTAGDFSFTGNVHAGGDLTVTGDATIGGNTTFTGGQTFAGAVDFDSTLNVDGAVTMGSTANVVGNLSVATNKFTVAAASGNTLVAGTLTSTGAVDCDSTLNADGSATFGGTLGVTGASTLGGAVDCDSTFNADGAATFGSTANIVGNLSVATNKLTVAAATGNTVIAGTLGVTGATTLTGALTANALIFPQQHATAGGPAYVEGAIYYDTTLHKLRVGGAAGWETITSA